VKDMVEWFKTVDKEKTDLELAYSEFFRDPFRPLCVDSNYFFSPADGIVLYAQTARKDDELFDIKGKAYRVSDICNRRFEVPVIVIGIFMTKWDVHWNRIPYSGHLTYKHVDPVRSKNMPMLAEEDDLLKGFIDKDALDYLFNNERVINTIYSVSLGFPYYVIQIADYDVDTITHFDTVQNQQVKQNDRFSMIRWGSQVDLIVPVHKNYKFDILAKPKFHVEGGIDKLIKIERD
jgi:phosphatidylserine decarboxylase